MNSDAVKMYLSEVLGIQAFLTPRSYEAPSSTELSSVKFRPEVDVTLKYGDHPTLLLWVPDQPGSEDVALLEKMMAAAKVSSYLIFWGAQPDQLQSFGEQLGLTRGLKFFGQAEDNEENYGGLKVINTSSLISMLKGPAREIQTQKKRVWGQIQDFLSLEIKGPAKK